MVEALTAGVGLVEAQGGWGKFKSFRDTFDFFGAENPLSKNSRGLADAGVVPHQAAKNSPNADITVLPFKDRQGKPLTHLRAAWVIPKGAKNPDAACEFMKQMTAADTWMAAAKARADARGRGPAVYIGVTPATWWPTR